ncbi:MAG: ComEA family DNA-binding protein [Caldiserica bacterium]|nr:MAG: ComEA family DNA-binding protein [Caldisericota bacterium]
MIFGKKEWIIAIIVSFAIGFTLGYHSRYRGINTENKEEITIETENKIYVHVAGEVRNPGVYEMSLGDRVFHAIEKAGGATEDADLDSINLAEKLKDGEKIIVYNKEMLNSNVDVSEKAISENQKMYFKSQSNLININTASREELETLPGIGEVLAQRIIDYRRTNGYFKSIEEIKEVSGIGEKKFEAIKDLITVGP